MILEKLKILIVEDDFIDYQLITHQIVKVLKSPSIAHATNFLEFTNELKAKTPDIIISDYNLTGCSGMDILNYAMEKFPTKYFIFLTGTINDEEIAANTILNGASGYILKKNMPQLSEKLKPHFEKVCERKKELKRNFKSKIDLESVQNFIDAARSNNQMHIESYQEIKNAILKYKTKNHDSKLS